MILAHLHTGHNIPHLTGRNPRQSFAYRIHRLLSWKQVYTLRRHPQIDIIPALSSSADTGGRRGVLV